MGLHSYHTSYPSSWIPCNAVFVPACSFSMPATDSHPASTQACAHLIQAAAFALIDAGLEAAVIAGSGFLQELHAVNVTGGGALGEQLRLRRGIDLKPRHTVGELGALAACQDAVQGFGLAICLAGQSVHLQRVVELDRLETLLC